jgi:hypothetical protein
VLTTGLAWREIPAVLHAGAGIDDLIIKHLTNFFIVIVAVDRAVLVLVIKVRRRNDLRLGLRIGGDPLLRRHHIALDR